MSASASASTSLTEIGHLGFPEETSDGISPNEYYKHYITSSSISEIEEEDEGSSSSIPAEIKDLFEIKKFSPMPSIKEEYDKGSLSSADDCVYVAVGKSPSSMEALTWTLDHVVSPSPSTMIYLVHIYPEIRQIPTPLGKLPLSQVSPEQVESYTAQERGKRRELLNTFLHKCSSDKVKVDTILIESDAVAKAILDLITILNIRKLVVGITKSSLRKLKPRKGSGVANQILKSAPETCEVKIICEGKEVIIDQAMTVETPSPSQSQSQRGSFDSSKSLQEEEEPNKDSISCMCFKSKFS
ncbi:hypothetical protein UlMin_016552 [Ulmus minor]